jgi:hypothetical protein
MVCMIHELNFLGNHMFMMYNYLIEFHMTIRNFMKYAIVDKHQHYRPNKAEKSS